MKKKPVIFIALLLLCTIFNLIQINALVKGKVSLISLNLDDIHYIYAEKVNIMDNPSEKAKVIGTAEIGNPVKLLKDTGKEEEFYKVNSNWYQVEYNGKTGYIWGGNISSQCEKADFNRDGKEELLMIQWLDVGWGTRQCLTRLCNDKGLITAAPFLTFKKISPTSVTCDVSFNISVEKNPGFTPEVPLVKLIYIYKDEKHKINNNIVTKEIIEYYYLYNNQFENLRTSYNLYYGKDFNTDVYYFPGNQNGIKNKLIVENRITSYIYDKSGNPVSIDKNYDILNTITYKWTGTGFVLEQDDLRKSYTSDFDIAAIAADSYGSIALKKDGTVWEWGNNKSSIVQYDKLTGDYPPVRVKELENIKAAATRGMHFLSVKKDGTVWELGFKVAGLDNVKSVAAERNLYLALKQDGTVWRWGNEETGDKKFVNYGNIPGKVNGLDKIVAIEAGSYNNLALKRDGTVWIFEKDTKQIEGLSKIKAVTTNGPYSFALNKNGTVLMWNYKNKPHRIKGLSKIVAIDNNNDILIALKNNGTVYMWRKNVYKPVKVPELSNVKAVAAGNEHFLALKKDGSVWVWGTNYYHQFGCSNITDKIIPIPVLFNEN